MPYLSYDAAESNDARRKAIKRKRNYLKAEGDKAEGDKADGPSTITKRGPEEEVDPKFFGSSLIKLYLKHRTDSNAEEWDGADLHVRRTLDQFFYGTEEDTKDRDESQVVYEYTKIHEQDMPSSKDGPIFMMVDQLWLWVLQDAAIRRSSLFLSGALLYNDLSNRCHLLPEYV